MIIKFLLLFATISCAYANRDDGLSDRVKNYKIEQLLKPHYADLNVNYYKDYIAHNINVNNEMTQSQKLLVEDTIYMQVFIIGTMGGLVLLPESITKWDLDTLKEKSLGENWRENVDAGPIWDEDDFAINYIGHPVSGAWYYTMARNDGLNQFESFLFSTFVSTFIWEYGYEAFAEIPSIQDLIFTPLVGSFMGEYMYYLQGQLDNSKGVIWGSKNLGNISYFLIDPIGNLSNGLSEFFDVSVTMEFQTYQKQNYIREENYNEAINKPIQFSSYNYGVDINFLF